MGLIAITRGVSPSINDCELSFHGRQPIDLATAIAQHEAYRECLKELAVRVVSLPAEPRLPDAVFVEDAAVVLDEIAVIPNMGAASRRPVAVRMAEALARYRPVEFLKTPATLDGGDVMRIGRALFVGLSQRTNPQAVEQLSALVGPHDYEVHPIQVTGCLHLKSACSYVGNNTILVNKSWIDVGPFRGFDLLDVPNEEANAANALLLRDVLVMAASFPKTEALLEARAFRVRTVDVSELQKAAAGVTCCSLILEESDPPSRTATARQACERKKYPTRARQPSRSKTKAGDRD